MRHARASVDRFRALVDGCLTPALAPLGFERRRSVLERADDEVHWLVEVELAPWTNPDRICFTLAWGVDVPGLDDVLGDVIVRTPGRQTRTEACVLHGRVGETESRVEASWLTVGPVAPVPGLEQLADARTARALLRMTDAVVLPTLRRYTSVPAVQATLVERLVRGRGAAREEELRQIRAIAGLSVLLDERENASRWLDYLEARSSASIAPDVVAERLAALRQRCAS